LKKFYSLIKLINTFIKNCGKDKNKSCLLIINDEYLSQNAINRFRDEHSNYENENENEDPFQDLNHDDNNNETIKIITKEKLVVYYLLEKLKKIDITNVVSLDIVFVNIKKFHFRKQQIKEIEPSIFNGLINLTSISLSGNRIKKLDPLIFSGLVNLEKIDFSYNQLQTRFPRGACSRLKYLLLN